MAKEKISVADLDVNFMRMRESVAGGLIIEFSGEDSTKRADAMAGSIRAAMGNDAVVSRPVRLAALRLRGFDLTVDQVEVRRAVASVGDCPVNDISVGEIGRLPGGRRRNNRRSVWGPKRLGEMSDRCG